ncbi:MAG: hypothetical protein AAFN94_06670 [Pseudomonadota bacterium]
MSAAMHNNPIPRLFLNALAIGLTLSAILIALMWIFNVAGFFDALAPSPEVRVALVVLWLSNGLLFGAVQVGYAMFKTED